MYLEPAVLLLGAGLSFVRDASAVPVSTPTKAVSASEIVEPCARVSSAIAAYVSEYPSANSAMLSAELAYECLMSVPFYPEPALNLTAALKPYIQIQSTIDYLKKPPSGYLYPAADLPGQLNAIEQKIQKGQYKGEYQFQLDLLISLTLAKDGHLFWQSDLSDIFGWTRPFELVAVSSDGVALPQVFVLSDVISIRNETVSPRNIAGASPVVKVNGIAVETWLNLDANVGSLQDPDANWNNELFQIQKASQGAGDKLSNPFTYPGPITNLTFANSSYRAYTNRATTSQSFINITSGADVYAKYCALAPDTDLGFPSSATTTTSAISTPTVSPSAVSSTSRLPDVTQLPYYPTPEVIDSSGLLSGHFLNSTGNKDVAVLAIAGFEPSNPSRPADEYFELGFQRALQNFLALATKKGSQKLVIDVQGNGGGAIDLALDAYGQLFPHASLNAKGNLRASYGMNRVTKAAAKSVDLAENQSQYDLIIAKRFGIPFSYQSLITPDAESFRNLSRFYGPYKLGNGKFTAFQQQNYTDDQAALLGSGVIITGTNNRTGFTQPFAAQNVVLVTDGYCASACTIFSEYLKNEQSVPQVVIGGRPHAGPMQAIGGVKGSQAFSANNIESMVDYFWNTTLNSENDVVNDTIWKSFSYLPVLRSTARTIDVNGKNQFRVGSNASGEIPLQFVYEAADARLWWTPDMVASPVAIWERVITVAFQNNFTSPYVVAGSTKQPTSVTGGLRYGQIGPQNPAASLKAATGWLVDGMRIVKKASGLGVFGISNATATAAS